MLRLLPEAPAHVPARELLLDRCFGPARFAKTCELLRSGRRPAAGLAFSLLDRGRLVGTARFWHIAAGSAGPALLLGPVAVEPERQGEGLGTRLMRHGLAKARGLGHGAVLLVGDAPYYGRFGFCRDLTQGLAMPGPVEPERFLGLELRPGALGGAFGLVAAAGPHASSPDETASAVPSIPFVTENLPILTHATAR